MPGEAPTGEGRGTQKCQERHQQVGAEARKGAQRGTDRWVRRRPERPKRHQQVSQQALKSA